MVDIGANLRAVKQRVARAAERSRRDCSEVELLVVTKTWSPSVITEVLEEGHTLLGENKLQEAEKKIAQLPDGLRWHFIGHLQRNKARKALALFGKETRLKKETIQRKEFFFCKADAHSVAIQVVRCK